MQHFTTGEELIQNIVISALGLPFHIGGVILRWREHKSRSQGAVRCWYHNRQLIAACVSAIAFLIGSLGCALWLAILHIRGLPNGIPVTIWRGVLAISISISEVGL